MTKLSTAAMAGLVVLALGGSPVLAHHGWGSYDSGTVLTIEGPIIEASYQYPHCGLVLEHEGQRWTIVLAPPSRMDRRGIPDGELEPGLAVTVEGYPSTVEPHEMRAERITVNGRTVELR
jgi:hypothetical protein